MHKKSWKLLQALSVVLIGFSPVASNAADNQFTKEIAASGIAGDPCAKPEKDPAIWNKTVAFGLSYTDGNSETTVLNLNAKVDRDYQDNIWAFELDGNYGESATVAGAEREKNKEDAKATGSYKHLLSERVYAGSGLAVLYDDIAEVDYRVTVSPGLGYFLLKSEQFKLSIEAGPAYIFEKVGDKKNDYLAPRVAEQFNWQISETAKLFQAVEVLFDVEDSDNTLVNSSIGVAAAINSSMSLVVSIKDTYDNVPAAGRERNDVALITALQVSL